MQATAIPTMGGLGSRLQASGDVLVTDQLVKTFKNTRAVNGLSFTVRAGEVLGFLGPNGAGKSTTVGMILGLIRPDSGTVTIMGEDVQSHRAVVPRHVGAIIENPAFYPYLSGRDNLRAQSLAVGGVPERRIDELLRLVRLNERGNNAFKTYSLGMKQRLGIASTLLTDPALIILDEPTNGLDPAGQREIREIIPDLADQGHSVLLASHLLHEVEQVSDRVTIVRRGELVTEGSIDDLLKRGGYIDVVVSEAEQRPAMDILRRFPGVEHVTIDDGHLHVVAPVELAADLNRALGEQGMFASQIVQRKSSLEDLFLDLTEGSTV